MIAKRGRGRPTFTPTDDQRAFVKSLAIFGHQHTTIADALKIDLNTLQKHFPDELSRGKREMDGLAIAGLYKGIKAGESWAILYWLRTQGKAFGFSERLMVDVTGSNSPFAGLDMSKLSPAKFRQFLELLTLAGANFTGAQEEELLLVNGPGKKAIAPPPAPTTRQ